MSGILGLLFSKAGLAALLGAIAAAFLAMFNHRGRKIRKLKNETVRLRTKERIRDLAEKTEDKADDLREEEEDPEALADWANDND